jgi:4-carboxymuconolactone decarboxylase|tara:strand:- start:3531 stop:3995 length:465 start_codon:yes stop_codon:yes gene_type:complete
MKKSGVAFEKFVQTGTVASTLGKSMSIFDEDLFLKGLEQRKSTLGAEYVTTNLDGADDFTRPFQEAMTAWCWGFGWGDDVIDAKTRSMMNLSMLGALGKMHEWEVHCKGAINNGVSVEEIRAIIHVIGIYCGVPQSVECFRSARKVLTEAGLLE